MVGRELRLYRRGKDVTLKELRQALKCRWTFLNRAEKGQQPIADDELQKYLAAVDRVAAQKAQNV